MTRELIAVASDQPVREVAQTMVSRGVHRVLVTAGRRLLGIVTTLDLVRAIADGRLSEWSRRARVVTWSRPFLRPSAGRRRGVNEVRLLAVQHPA